MKITINFNNKETNTIERLVNKYAPISDECMKIEDDHYDHKFGVMDVKRTEDGTDMSIDLKADFVIESLKFLDDIMQPIMTACKSLKFLFEGAKERFKKWSDNEEDMWNLVAKSLGEKSTDTKIIGLIKHYDWVQIDERTKKLDTVWSHYPVASEEDLANCIKEAGENEVRFVKIGHGDWHLESSLSQVARWVGDLYGTSYEGKHVAE